MVDTVWTRQHIPPSSGSAEEATPGHARTSNYPAQASPVADVKSRTVTTRRPGRYEQQTPDTVRETREDQQRGPRRAGRPRPQEDAAVARPQPRTMAVARQPPLLCRRPQPRAALGRLRWGAGEATAKIHRGGSVAPPGVAGEPAVGGRVLYSKICWFFHLLTDALLS